MPRRERLEYCTTVGHSFPAPRTRLNDQIAAHAADHPVVAVAAAKHIVAVTADQQIGAVTTAN